MLVRFVFLTGFFFKDDPRIFMLSFMVPVLKLKIEKMLRSSGSGRFNHLAPDTPYFDVFFLFLASAGGFNPTGTNLI